MAQNKSNRMRRKVRLRRPIEPLHEQPARLWRAFLTGLVAVIPLAVTAYVIYWLFSAADALFNGIGEFLLPAGWHFPGLGILLAMLLILALGVVLKSSVSSRLALQLGSRVLERIPLIKTVYGGVRDLMLFVSRPQDEDSRHVVLVTLPGELRMIGFVTDPAPAEIVPQLQSADGAKVLAVYLPMSYQIGGYTLYLPEHYLQRLDMPVEAAMRMVLTAGMNRPGTSTVDAAPSDVTAGLDRAAPKAGPV